MPAEPPYKRQRGLEGVRKVREMRVAGKYARPTERMWLAVGIALIALVGGYRYFSGRSLGGEKADLLGKRGAIEVTVGAQWRPLRDKIEQVTVDEAGGFKGDFVDESARTLSFRDQPGLYLRLKVEDARSAEGIRSGARGSLRDAFTSCLLRTTNEPLARGDVDASAFPDQPWNLRQAYAATRILTDEWKREVSASDDSLRLRVFQQQYDKAILQEIPVAIDIVKRARFFLLVLDEDAPEAGRNEAGVTSPETLQLVPHEARVVVYDFKRQSVVVRLRRSAQGAFMPAGERPITDPEMRDSVQRQVNNCSLAQSVTSAISQAK